MTTPYSLTEFLALTNERARSRLFTADDYARYCAARDAARLAARAGCPFYATADTGGVANAYKYTTTTAQWGVWATNRGTVEQVVHRPRISGRHVPCAYYGGARAYAREFAEGVVGVRRDTPPPVPVLLYHGSDPDACTACHQALEGLYYTGQRWGESLCEPCYEARVAQGLAKQVMPADAKGADSTH